MVFSDLNYFHGPIIPFNFPSETAYFAVKPPFPSYAIRVFLTGNHKVCPTWGGPVGEIQCQLNSELLEVYVNPFSSFPLCGDLVALSVIVLRPEHLAQKYFQAVEGWNTPFEFQLDHLGISGHVTNTYFSKWDYLQ